MDSNDKLSKNVTEWYKKANLDPKISKMVAGRAGRGRWAAMGWINIIYIDSHFTF